MSTVVDPARARPALTEALSIFQQLDEQHKLTTEEKNWLDKVRVALSKLP